MIVNQTVIVPTDINMIISPAELPGVAIDAEGVRKPVNASPEALLPHREQGDQINGFLLCILISKSAKRIKIRAERVGVSLPMSSVTRTVQCAYHLAAKDEDGPFANLTVDIPKLMNLNEKIFRNEVARYGQTKVKK